MRKKYQSKGRKSNHREPDARKAPVRFDEREQEAEPCQTGLMRRGENYAKGHREATATAPVLDSTKLRPSTYMDGFPVNQDPSLAGP